MGEEICRVVHCKKEKYDIYIGRPSKWGNPFSHKAGTKAEFQVATREEAVKRYEEYLLNSPELLDALPELFGKVLGCWCAPQLCHGHILAFFARAAFSKMMWDNGPYGLNEPDHVTHDGTAPYWGQYNADLQGK